MEMSFCFCPSDFSIYCKSFAQNKYATRANRCPMERTSPHNKICQKVRFKFCEDDCDASHKMALILHLY